MEIGMKKNCKFDSKKLIDKYSNMIFKIALRYFESEADAEDIVQEVFLRYIGYIKTGNIFNSDEHEKCWIIRVTMNLCCNAVNRAKLTKTMPLNECFYMELNLNSENLLLEAVKKLDEKYKIVFELFYFDGLKVTEISKVLEISVSNVKTRLKRARDMVKDFMRKERKSYGRIR